jgi:GNAT superfamily N-acetyltransferase|tara:strand:- start:56 stop:649 length:594 start_codon:yes stop_codon:yes gene_type:complete
MKNELVFRSGKLEDSTELALIFDMAGRRIPSYLWGLQTLPGQSAFEVGRERIRTGVWPASHFSNWHIAEVQNQIIGAFFGFVVEEPYPEIDFEELEPCLHPIKALEKEASGRWLLQVMAILPEARGKGYAKEFLKKADQVAMQSGVTKMALQVEEVNETAHRIYEKFGYYAVDRRPFIPFPGSVDKGDYILMFKNLT